MPRQERSHCYDAMTSLPRTGWGTPPPYCEPRAGRGESCGCFGFLVGFVGLLGLVWFSSKDVSMGVTILWSFCDVFGEHASS